MRKTSIFNPTQHDFCYNLTKDTCFRVKTGKCSLDLTTEEIHEYELQETEEDKLRGKVNYCINLYKDLKSNGFRKPILVASNPCGHFSFTDGQHRTCISKSKGITEVPAHISTNKSCNCAGCERRMSIFFIR